MHLISLVTVSALAASFVAATPQLRPKSTGMRTESPTPSGTPTRVLAAGSWLEGYMDWFQAVINQPPTTPPPGLDEYVSYLRRPETSSSMNSRQAEMVSHAEWLAAVTSAAAEAQTSPWSDFSQALLQHSSKMPITTNAYYTAVPTPLRDFYAGEVSTAASVRSKIRDMAMSIFLGSREYEVPLSSLALANAPRNVALSMTPMTRAISDDSEMKAFTLTGRLGNPIATVTPYPWVAKVQVQQSHANQYDGNVDGQESYAKRAPNGSDSESPSAHDIYILLEKAMVSLEAANIAREYGKSQPDNDESHDDIEGYFMNETVVILRALMHMNSESDDVTKRSLAELACESSNDADASLRHLQGDEQDDNAGSCTKYDWNNDQYDELEDFPEDGYEDYLGDGYEDFPEDGYEDYLGDGYEDYLGDGYEDYLGDGYEDYLGDDTEYDDLDDGLYDYQDDEDEGNDENDYLDNYEDDQQNYYAEGNDQVCYEDDQQNQYAEDNCQIDYENDQVGYEDNYQRDVQDAKKESTDPKTSSDSLADLVMATETKSDIFYDSLVLPSGVFLCNKASDSAAIECVRTISKTESFQTVQTTETLHYTIPTDLQGALITDFENRSPLIPTLETKSEATRETGLFVTGVAVVGILGVIAFL